METFTDASRMAGAGSLGRIGILGFLGTLVILASPGEAVAQSVSEPVQAAVTIVSAAEMSRSNDAPSSWNARPEDGSSRPAAEAGPERNGTRLQIRHRSNVAISAILPSELIRTGDIGQAGLPALMSSHFDRTEDGGAEGYVQLDSPEVGVDASRSAGMHTGTVTIVIAALH